MYFVLSLLGYPSKLKALFISYLQAWYSILSAGMFISIEFLRYFAEFLRAFSAPYGDHENLYPKQLSQASGLGSPPQ